MILYPTETLYALGVNAFDKTELNKLYELKGRDAEKVASWLVRSVDDIADFAVMSETARKIAEGFLPGPLTLVLETNTSVPSEVTAKDGTIGFRVSQDPFSEKIINEFMSQYKTPLTCTSANVSGSPTFPTVSEILQQFAEKANQIKEIHDDGPRKGLASTVVKVIGDNVTIIREGEISEKEIRDALLN